MSRNSDALAIADQLEKLLDRLASNMAALSAILDPAEEAAS